MSRTLPKAQQIEIAGDPDAGALLFPGPAVPRACVVVSHGGGNDHLYGLWYAIERLVGAGFAVLTGHLAGHGKGGQDLFSLANAQRRLDALAREAGQRFDRLFLLGQSLGGALALDSLARGQSWQAAVSVSAPHNLQVGTDAWLETAALFRPTTWRALRYAGPYEALPAFKAFKRGRFPVRVTPGTNYLREFEMAVAQMDLLARLSDKVSSPLLLVHGARDGVIPPFQASELSATSGATATLYIAPRCHHLEPLLERSTLDAIVEFLDGSID
jgi:alpha-beta hydrolase superfamily lysophospholipase